jgi:hypothetical protein
MNVLVLVLCWPRYISDATYERGFISPKGRPNETPMIPGTYKTAFF